MQDPSWWKDVKVAIDILVTCFDVTIFFFVSRIPSNMTSAEDIFLSFQMSYWLVCYYYCCSFLRFQTFQLINILFLADAYSCCLVRIEFIPKSAKNNSKQTPEYTKRDCACYSKADHQIHRSIY